MANTSVVANRRDEIGARWLKGQSVASIARELDVPLGTVKHDLHYIRSELRVGQGDVLRMIRARSMAVIELVCAEAWRRLDALTGSDEPDDQAIIGYMGVLLKGQGQAAKLAGLPTQATSDVAYRVFNRDIYAWIEENVPEVRAEREKREARAAEIDARYATPDEDEDDGGISAEEYVERMEQVMEEAYERGREDALAEARTVDAATGAQEDSPYAPKNLPALGRRTIPSPSEVEMGLVAQAKAAPATPTAEERKAAFYAHHNGHGGA
jgi:hypothetical protein